MDSPNTTSASTSTLVYRWIIGILIGMMIAGFSYMLNAFTMQINTRMDYIIEQLKDVRDDTAQNRKQIQTNTERLAIIEWQLKQLYQMKLDSKSGY